MNSLLLFHRSLSFLMFFLPRYMINLTSALTQCFGFRSYLLIAYHFFYSQVLVADINIGYEEIVNTQVRDC